MPAMESTFAIVAGAESPGHLEPLLASERSVSDIERELRSSRSRSPPSTCGCCGAAGLWSRESKRSGASIGCGQSRSWSWTRGFTPLPPLLVKARRCLGATPGKMEEFEPRGQGALSEEGKA